MKHLSLPVWVFLWFATSLIVACGTDTDEPNPSDDFDAVLSQTIVITSESEAGPDDIPSVGIADGESFQVELYEVPGFPCVRQSTDDLTELPAGAVVPGEPGVFAIAYPAPDNAGEGGLLYFPHGNSSEVLEAAAVTIYNDDSAVYDSIYAASPEYIGMITDQTSVNGALAHVRSMLAEPLSLELLRRGWTLVTPGNCWGDSGIGTGEIIDGFYSAPRWGREFDRGAIDFAQRQYSHSQELFAFGMSGGGARLAQLVMDDPDLFRALVFDSPNDYLGAAVSEPMPSTYALLDMLAGGIALPLSEAYIADFYGSVEGTEAYSLGYRLGRDIHLDDVPILMAYVTEDPQLHADAFMPLADALQTPDRYSNEFSQVLEFDSDEHCPLKDLEDQRTVAAEFLEQFLD